MKKIITIGIESSCDDTAIGIISGREILANIISTELEQHQIFGGVVPEIAARNHTLVIDELINLALTQAGLKISEVDLIAATGGPGLIGGVITSVMIAKGLAISNQKPLIFVNHLEGHALTARLNFPDLEYPFLLLLASGGHSQILHCSAVGKYQKLGGTLDDAIGESFDKVGKMLGLAYPAGPIIELLAKNGDENLYPLPQGMINDKSCNLSLSGLKTAVRNLVLSKKDQMNDQLRSDIAASFQNAVTKQILNRLEYAIVTCSKMGVLETSKKLVFAGGVAANFYIREKLVKFCEQHGFTAFFPELKLCSDNGVMIAWAGYENYLAGNLSDLSFKPKARWNLSDLSK